MMWIDFYLNVGDLFVYVCWLLCKVYQVGQLVVVFVEFVCLCVFDEWFWMFLLFDFILYCGVDSEYVVGMLIVLVVDFDCVLYYYVLLNFGVIVFVQFVCFECLFEVVGNVLDELVVGCVCYWFYCDCGYVLNNYKQGGQL